MTQTPLWTDDRIEDYANATYDASFYFEVVESMKLVRDDLQAGLTALENDNDSLRQQVKELETQLAALDKQQPPPTVRKKAQNHVRAKEVDASAREQ